MATLRGPGAMTNVNLVVGKYDKSVYTNDKGNTSHFVDAMVDHRDARAAGDSNLHISRKDGKDGRTNNDQAYSDGQWNAIVEAAGENKTPMRDKEGNEVGTYYAVKGSLMKTGATELVINTKKPLGPSDFQIDEKTNDAQFDHMKAAKAAKQAAKAEKAAAAPAAETPEATQSDAKAFAEAQADEPQVG